MNADRFGTGDWSASLGARRIALLVSDVDGTLVTREKTLTVNASSAVLHLAKTGIGFTLVSARPPRGMASLVAALDIKLPFAGFNGGALVRPDMSVIETHRLSASAACTMLGALARHDVEVWVFADGDWRLRNPNGPHVADLRHTIGFDPTIVRDFDDVIDRIDKIVGVSDRPERLSAVEAEARILLQGQATIDLSQPFYLDVTAVESNKGRAVESLCAILGVDRRNVAVIGDMMNDVSMFQVAGFSIAMGQSLDSVKAAAAVVTGSNAEDGFADAVAHYILPRASARLAAR